MHWTEKYLTRPYIPKEYDCASLVCDVQRDEFGVDVPDFGERPALRSQSYSKLLEEMDRRLTALDEPTEGAIVEILSIGDLPHVGVYSVVNGRPCVLHNTKKYGVLITPVQELARHGWRVQGYFKWT